MEKRRDKIAVIGGRSCSAYAHATADEVGYRIIESGNILYSGGASGIGDGAEKGGLRACKCLGLTPSEWIFICLPWHETKETEVGMRVKMGSSWGERRKLMMEAVDGAIAISGGVGTADEIHWANEFDKPVVPIGGEGTAEGHRKDVDGIWVQEDPTAPGHAMNELLELLREKGDEGG